MPDEKRLFLEPPEKMRPVSVALATAVVTWMLFLLGIVAGIAIERWVL